MGNKILGKCHGTGNQTKKMGIKPAYLNHSRDPGPQTTAHIKLTKIFTHCSFHSGRVEQNILNDKLVGN